MAGQRTDDKSNMFWIIAILCDHLKAQFSEYLKTLIVESDNNAASATIKPTICKPLKIKLSHIHKLHDRYLIACTRAQNNVKFENLAR